MLPNQHANYQVLTTISPPLKWCETVETVITGVRHRSLHIVETTAKWSWEPHSHVLGAERHEPRPAVPTLPSPQSSHRSASFSLRLPPQPQHGRRRLHCGRGGGKPAERRPGRGNARWRWEQTGMRTAAATGNGQGGGRGGCGRLLVVELSTGRAEVVDNWANDRDGQLEGRWGGKTRLPGAEPGEREKASREQLVGVR